MNFVAQLEDYLRDLGAESRKKHPGVKEASERANIKLRMLKTEYVSAVRKATSAGTEHPTTSLFQSQDLLHPFLLAANYPNASPKLLDISFKAMRLLMESNAICTGDGIHMVRVWTIQANVIMSQYQRHNKSAPHKSGEADINNSTSTGNGSSPSRSAVSTASSIASTTASWLGIGSLIGVSTPSSTPSNAESNEPTSSKPIMKNAVSSSSTSQYNASSNKEMEKTALEILSCLLKLTELLKNYSPSHDLWTQGVSLCCLLLDFKKTVQQAAHSTLPQVLSILYQSSEEKKYNRLTWEDLLVLASHGPNKKLPALQGAFSQCRIDSTSTKSPPPPSPELALELMATILKERPDLLAASDKFLSRTMSVTVALLQQTNKKSFDLTKTLRIFQWTLVVLQTQSVATLECRELLMHVIKPINTATDACRAQNNFDDGYVYTGASSDTGDGGNSPLNNSVRRLSTIESTNGTQNGKLYTSMLPNSLLWKAGLAVETVYHVLSNCTRAMRLVGEKPHDANVQALSRLLDPPTVVVLTETLSEFCSVGAGCQSHILQLVDVCRNTNEEKSKGDNSVSSLNNTISDFLLRSISHDEDSKSETSIEPMLFHKAEQLIKSGSLSSLFEDSSLKANNDKKAATAAVSVSSPIVHVVGETLWIAFHGVLEIVASVLPSVAPDTAETLAEAAFAPSLETLQHFMKRAPGSRDISRMSLTGYANMSNLCMPSRTPGSSFKRKALLTSLCKLSLPAWGKYDATTQLQNHHVRALICLLRIIHSHYDHIHSEWDMILLTFEELSIMAISSPFLSDQMYHAALAVSAVYGRFAPFSTCFSDVSLLEFMDALATVLSSATQKRDFLTTADNAVLDRVLVSLEPSKPVEKGDEAGVSIGGKLVNLGVRAIYGAQQAAGEASEPNTVYDAPIAKRTKSFFFEAYRSDFVGRLEQTVTSSLRPDHVMMLPFGLALLADVALANYFRYDICVGPASRHICNFALQAPAIRVPVMDIVSLLILFRLNKLKNAISFEASARVVYQHPKQHQLLAVEPSSSSGAKRREDSIPFSELFGPICDCIQTAKSAVVAEAATTMLTSILESVGHTLTGEVWAVIINAIASLSGDSQERKESGWKNCCLLGFRCLKLIVDDFLDNLPPLSEACGAARSSLLDCCSSFGRARHDLNTSLTAIGLLWTLADQDAATDAIDRALSKLAELSSDSRPEVRNCSINTLFSCIVGRGNGFSASQWEYCILDTVFGVCDLVLAKANDSGDDKVDLDGNTTESRKSRYKVNVHHSRDSAGKQWLGTQVLTLQGLSRVLRAFFTRLLDLLEDQASNSLNCAVDKENDDDEEEEEEESSEEDESDYEEEEEEDTEEEVTERFSEDQPWLITAWSRILDLALQAAAQEGGRDTVDVRSAGVELLVLCGQLSCRAGIQAAIAPARVGTNMQVVNGALRAADDSSGHKDANQAPRDQRTHSKEVDDSRSALFLASMEKMESYREFVERTGSATLCSTMGMEAAQLQVLQKFIICLSSLYDCCKDEELSQAGEVGDKMAMNRFFVRPQDRAGPAHLECKFVTMLTTVARAASGGPRFLSPAQRASLDLLRAMMKNGSKEAFLQSISMAGPSLFCRKDEGQEKGFAVTGDAGGILLSTEFSMVVADEVASEAITDVCKSLGLWLALSQFPAEIYSSERKSEGRLKAYFKNFLPLLYEGLGNGLSQIQAVGFDGAERVEAILCRDIWKALCHLLRSVLTPIPDATGLQKISRVPEVLDVLKYSIAFVPSEIYDDICSVLSQGASEALSVENANRGRMNQKVDGEMNRRRTKYREDALLIFKACYGGICRRKPDDPGLLKVTNKAFADALATLNHSGDNDDVAASVDACLMVCQALQENPGLEDIIVSSFPLLCKLVQTNNDMVRNAAAGALGSADLRRVLSDAKLKCEEAENRAKRAEQEASELRRAVAELQAKNEAFQKQVT